VEIQIDDKQNVFVEARHVLMVDIPDQPVSPDVVVPTQVVTPDITPPAPPQPVSPSVVVSPPVVFPDVVAPPVSEQAVFPDVVAKPSVVAERKPPPTRSAPSHTWSTQFYPRYEVFLGYSLMKTNESDDMKEWKKDNNFSEQIDKFTTLLPKGFAASFAYNFSSAIGLETSVRYNSGTVVKSKDRDIDYEYEHEFRKSDFSLLVGPRFTLRSGRIAPFAHVLAGLSHERVENDAKWRVYDVPGAEFSTGSHNSFGLSVVGGLFIAITDHIAIRAIQADYYLTDHPRRFYTNDANEKRPGSKTYKNLNLSFGVVFRFGN